MADRVEPCAYRRHREKDTTMVEMEKVDFCYANSERGVSDIDLKLGKGECVVLTGRSGGGKSTILHLLNGLAPQYYQGKLSGSIFLDKRYAEDIPLWQRGWIIGSIFQEPQSQFFSAELAGEIAFGCENYGLSRQEIIQKTERAIEIFELGTLRHRSLDLLSSGEKQRAAIASVYAVSPEIYACDEPTANLDEESALKLAEVFKKLKSEGRTLIIVEHRLSWLHDIADRYIYIKEGRVLWDRTREQIEEMTERDKRNYGLRSLYPIEKPSLPPPEGSGTPILQAERVYRSENRKSAKRILKEISFAAWAGQVIAITGHNGAGKTTLGNILSGLKRESGGSIRLDGRKSGMKARRKKIWYSANDTATQFFTDSVSEEVLLSREITTKRAEQATDILKQLGLYEFKEAHPATLSGGQKQRLSIACGLLSDREILIFDEPTSGVDGYHVEIISDAFRKAAENGRVVLIISHDYELIRRCCDYSIELGED